MKEKKLLVLSQLFYPELVSTGQVLTELCEMLVSFGAHVEVLTGPPTIVSRTTKVPKYLEYKGIKIVRVFSTRFPKLSFLGKLLNQITFTFSVFIRLLFNFSKHPILVVSNPPFLPIICGLLKVVHKRSYIVLIHDVYPDIAIKLGFLKSDGVIPALWNILNRFAFRKANYIVVLGRCMKEVIERKLERGLDSKKIKTIHVWGDDTQIFGGLKKNNIFREKWSLKGKFVLSYSGNMGRFHDMETIMETAKVLKDKTDIVFLFVGEGQKKNWMEEFVKKWNLTNCKFFPYVDKKDLGYMLTCADVGLVSLVSGVEGLSVPSKLYGLLSGEIPVIAVMSENSEAAKVIKENNCGFVVKPGNVEGMVNSILHLYDNREICKIFGKNGRNAIDGKYNLRKAAEQYFSLIKALHTRPS